MIRRSDNENNHRRDECADCEKNRKEQGLADA